MTCWFCGRFTGADVKTWKGRDACADCFGESYDRWISKEKPLPKFKPAERIESCRRCEDQWYVSKLENGYCWNCVLLLQAIREDLAANHAKILAVSPP